MKKCGLLEFRDYCYKARPVEYYVEVGCLLSATFESVMVLTFPDSICFKDQKGNCLSVYGITKVYHDDDKFLVYSDCFNTELEIRIHCLI